MYTKLGWSVERNQDDDVVSYGIESVEYINHFEVLHIVDASFILPIGKAKDIIVILNTAKPIR